MTRGKGPIIREPSSSSTENSEESEEMETSEEIEESEEERSLSPQPVMRCQRESTSRRSEADVYDSVRFSIRRNQEWHKTHANLEFIFEKHISLKIETVYHIFETFTQFDWVSILTLPTHYYSDLVREFYANIINKASHSRELVDSWVRST